MNEFKNPEDLLGLWLWKIEHHYTNEHCKTCNHTINQTRKYRAHGPYLVTSIHIQIRFDRATEKPQEAKYVSFRLDSESDHYYVKDINTTIFLNRELAEKVAEEKNSLQS